MRVQCDELRCRFQVVAVGRWGMTHYGEEGNWLTGGEENV